MFTITPDHLRKKTNRQLRALFEAASRAAIDPHTPHTLRVSAEAVQAAIRQEIAARGLCPCGP